MAHSPFRLTIRFEIRYLHIAGMGGAAITTAGATLTAQSDLHSIFDLTTAGVTLTKVDGNAQLAVTGGNRITATNDSSGTNCTTANNTGNIAPAAASAACGSVQVNGTVTSVAFNMSAVFIRNSLVRPAANIPASGDGVAVTITLPEDFSDAPATYNPTQAPVHVLSNLTLGATVDEDNTNVRNSATSPSAGAGAAGDGADEDAFVSLSDISTANSGGSYSLTVPTAGISKAARLCGYIDWNKNGTFEVATEQACTSPAAGATSNTLTWTVPAGITPGATYARFRLGYTAAQVQAPTGRADSGEVEDYPVNLVLPPLNMAKTAGTLSGPTAAGIYTVTYAITVQNTSTPATTYGPITDTSSFDSDLTVTGASWTGQATGSATGTGPFTIGAANTTIAAGATHTYNLSVTFRYSGTGTTAACGGPGTGLYNAVTLPGTQETGALTDNNACVPPPPLPAPAITVDKTAGAPSGNTAGSTITYTFVVTNSGNVPLTAVGVTDPKVGPVTCPVAVLAAGASTTCTKVYTLTQADVDAGSVPNTATATGTPPGPGTPVTGTDSVTTPITRTPAITIDKQAGTPSGTTAGSTITYTFIVTNTGNVNLTAMSVSDPKVGPVTCPVTSLAPAASTTCTKAYTLTQADVDAGVVNNTATATGTPPAGLTAPTATDNTTTNIARTATLTLDKQAGGATGSTAGSTITYSFVVTNTGNTTLTGLAISDPKTGPITCATTTLAPGAQTTCTKVYTITQADVDFGSVPNTATATATPPVGVTPPPSASDSTSTPLTPGPAITLDKQAGTPSGTTAGSTIAYTFLVTNTGNVTLNPVTVTDNKVGTVTCPAGALAPGANRTCTASYTITQADIDSGSVINTATANGTPPTGAPVQATDSNTRTLTRTTTITLDKQAGTPSGTTAGATIAYTFLVTNTGNVTLNPISVSDAKVGTVTCAAGALAPGASRTCTATYTLTQVDVDSGHVANSATATGTPPAGLTAPTATDTTDTPIARAGAITLDKQGGTPSGNTAGSTIAYTFLVTNTGNVSLTSVGVADPKVGTVTCPVATLAPLASTTCTATYTLTQADVDAGTVLNTAIASGTPPTGPAVSATDAVTTPITRTSTITLDKVAGTPSGATAGSTIAYTFLVTNTGNVTLNPVSVSDAKVGAVTCPVTNLAPGAATTCTATYTLTQADVNAGVVNNTATATGTPPVGVTAPTATDSTTTPITRTPAISLDKQAGAPSGTTAGSTIAYTFVVTNTGNVTLNPVSVSDPKVGAVTCPVTNLAPAASTTCTATYTVTQVDVDSGQVANTATATGTPPVGLTAPTATDNTDTPISSGPAITLDKTAGTPSGNTAGSTIAYTFLVSNTGNVSLAAVSVSDPTAGAVTCPVTTLAPGANTLCTATYTLTQADVDAGSVVNVATATGTPPTGTPPTGTDTTTTTITRATSITLDKQAATPSGATAGSTIDYTFVVTNTGNVTLDPISVSDPKVGPVTCPVTLLAPAGTTTCTATYTLTQADVDAAHVANVATTTGTPPAGMTPPTATDNTDTPIVAGPTISLDKQAGAPTGSTAGSTITYTFIVTNTGNVTLNTVSVSDPKVGPVTCPVTTLAPLAATTCTKVYTITQADVDAGQVDNNASASGIPPVGGAVTAVDDTTTPLATTPAITLDKQAGTPSGTAAGDTIDYTFLVANTGNVTLNPVSVDDPAVGAVTCPVTTLAPAASTTCTATYVLTQIDVNAGHFANTATANGTPPTGADVTATDDTDTPIVGTRAITLDKTASAPTGADAGDTIDYSFLLTNTGQVTLDPVSVDDPKVGAVTCPVTVLAPGEDTTCTATYILTQADIDAGEVVNEATGTGIPPSGPPPTGVDVVTTPIPSNPSITLDKVAGTPSGDSAGDTIAYTFLVTNTGNVTLNPVSVDDPAVGAVSCPATTLAPTASTTCTATYVLTQADVDAGEFVNVATASGTPPTGDPVTAEDTTTTPIVPDPSITLDKVAGTPTGNSAGDTIPYTFIVTNTGNVTLDPVSVDDPLLVTVICPQTTLAPAESMTCSQSYTIQQLDVDSGHFANTATANGTPPTGADVTATDDTDTPLIGAPAITLDKVAGTPTGNAAGDTIDYTFLVTNTGNVTLNPVSVDDPAVGAVTCPVGVLAPAASTTCTATYTLTQTDVDAGEFVNVATASGTPPTGDAVTAEDTTTTPILAEPVITLDKVAGTPTGNAAGDTIDYTFLVTNTGNVTLDPVAVDDPAVGAVTCPVSILAPAASTTCTATYVLTQGDVDAGEFVNVATASGTPPTGDAVTAEDTTTTPILAEPVITLDKVAGTATGNAAGDTIDYTFVVTNAGNVTLNPVSVDDPAVGAVTCPVTTLAPAASTTCTATYALTQLDVDAGHFANTATASGTPPTGAAVTAIDDTDTPITAEPAITLDKVAGPPTGTSAGDTIDYTFTVTNTGNVTLNPVSVDDPAVGTVDCPVTVLAPDEATICTATYTLTQTDVDAGEFVNVATASGAPPIGDLVTAEDTTTTPIPATPVISLEKTAGTPSGNALGDTIDYTFLVTNEGNVTLDPISVSDPKVGAVACPVTVLAPGASTTCTATYSLTQADVDAGEVVNVATASGTPPTGDPVTAEDTTTTPIPADPVIELDKQAGVPTGNSAGDTIDFTFIVTNAGNVTLDPVVVDDPAVGSVTCPVSILAPLGSTTCTATYVLTQVDVDAGHFANIATATGTSPTGVDVTATDDTDTPILGEPEITLEKTAGTPTGNSAGDTIDYTFLVTNLGNVTLDPVSVDDPKVGAVNCPVTVLAPAASTTCTATYTLLQADVDAGQVINIATTSGTPPTGDPVTAEDTITTSIPADPSITLDKVAGVPTGANAGDTIDYEFIVTNTGNVTLNPVGVNDPAVGTVTCPVTTLAPAESTTCTATYTLLQSDVDAGHFANLATASGTPPTGAAVTATDETDTTIPATPTITLDKVAGTPTGIAAGETIDYTFLVTNTGNVTLDPISVDDPSVGTVDCPVTVLAPGEDTTCTATYVLTQADVDAGEFVNVATASGTPPIGDPVTSEDTTTTDLPAAPVITLDKIAGAPTGTSASDTIDYTFVVTNTGNVTLDPIAVDDPKVGTVSCPVTALAPAATTTCTATYVLTQEDVDGGAVVNVATASGTPPTGDPVTAEDTTTTDLPADPSITLDKQAGVPTGDRAGDTIAYTFVVTNTGNVTLDPVAVDDPKVGTVDCPVTMLAPEETVTCTATYVLTQEDVDAGEVVNLATASGTPPTGDPVTAEDTTTTTIPADPSITLDKQAGVPTGTRAGDTIDYTFIVTNTGNVTLDPVSVDDPAVGAVACPVSVLAPDESTTCTATYALSQLDVDAGHFANTATASGTPPVGDPVTATDDTDTPIAATPTITLDKQAGVPSGPFAGDTIDYTFLVTNTGNVTLNPVSVDDPAVGAVTCPASTLAPDESTTCTATYTLTQLDVDSGHFANTATASGTPPIGDPVTAIDDTDTPIAAGPVITLDKQAADPSGNFAGDTIDYTFLVTNTGNVTLNPVSVDDPKVGAVTCPETTLAPAAATTCTATYVLTQADVDEGEVVNIATASGTPPTGDPVTAEDTVTTVIPAAPVIVLDKQAGPPSGSAAGDTIEYTFVITNDGNVTLDPVTLDDPLVNPVTCPATLLAPGDSITCTATYELTQADIDLGEVVNNATATGTPPNEGDQVTSEDTTTTPIEAFPLIQLVKSADTAGPVAAGDIVNYSFEVTNVGNVTLSDLVVNDPMLGSVSCPETVLAPAGSMICTGAPYTVTPADVLSGKIVNVATAVGVGRLGQQTSEVSDVSDVVVRTSAPPAPAIKLKKTASKDGPFQIGDTIRYSFTVTNTGNVPLTSVGVSDPMLGKVTCKDTTLLAGDSTTCKADPYTVTTKDIRAGEVVNTAEASAACPFARTDGVLAKCPVITAKDSVTSQTMKIPTIPETGNPVPQVVPLAAITMLGIGLSLLVAGRRRSSRRH